MNAPIVPGLRISGPGGHGVCRLGLIARDEARQRILGLSARHVLWCDSKPEIFELDSDRQIGERTTWPHAERGSTKFFETIAAFELSAPGTDYANRVGDKLVLETAEPALLLGERILKISDGRETADGEIVAVGGAVRFTDPYLRFTEVLRGAIEVRFRRGGKDPTAPQEAGALIVDERYAAVGLLICGERDRAFVAPLHDFMVAHNLSLPGARSAAPGDGVIARMEADLDQASIGSEQLLRDLRAEGNVHEDPGNEDVPRHLTDLLRRP